MRIAAVLAGVGLFFSACLKNNDGFPDNNTAVAGLMAFNLAPGQNAVNFSISGNSLTPQPLIFTNYTGAYLNIFPGSRVIEARNASTGLVYDTARAMFDSGKYYSAFLVGKDSATFQTMVVSDDIDTLTAPGGVAYVRYINAIPGAGSANVQITSGGSSLFDEASSFPAASAFKAVAPADVAISVTGEGGINTSRTIPVEARRVYTILLVGDAASTNPTDAVQVKFIVNGQVAQ